MKQVNTGTTPPGSYRYRQPETGQSFEATTWQALLEQVGNHRLGEHLDLSFGWNKQLEHDACEQNPQWGCRESDPLLPAHYAEIAAIGRSLWAELHTYANAYPENPSAEAKTLAGIWLKDFSARVPQFGCGCRSHWDRLVNGYPPELGSRSQFVVWAENAHSWVSRRVGKPIWHPERFAASPAANI